EWKRDKLLARLLEQKELLKDAGYTRTAKKRGEDGKMAAKYVQVRPWWRTNGNGVAVSCRIAGKLVEFQPGKNAIVVSDLEKVEGVLDALIAAVRNGEFDQQLSVKGKMPARKSLKVVAARK